MKKHVRTITIVAVALLLPIVLLMPITQAKRAKKNPAKQPTQPSASKASLPTRLTSLVRPQTSSPTPVSVKAVGFAVTAPLSEMEQKDKRSESMRRGKAEANQERPEKNVSPPLSGYVDPPASKALSAAAEAVPAPNIPATIANFEGLSSLDNAANPAIGGFVFPPDTVGDVSPTQYVQATNLLFRVFSKAGAPLTPTQPISALFTAMGGRCATSDDGDPIVLYDSFADRWIITQFVVNGAAPLGQCFAISQTGDATGAYFTYDFVMPNNKFNDYPKFGVWPDGYYWSNNQFNLAGTAFLGVGVFALDRAKLLAGDPTATYIYFDLESNTNARSMLPSDADGLNPPPAGAPNVFAYFNANEFLGDLGDSLRMFNFHADFAVPANSTFIERPESPVAVAAFDPRNPAGLDDIEQPPPSTATSAVDSISDRLMHRLQYRNYGTHQALTVNHTVNVGTGTTLALHQAGVRYYELRNTAGTYAVREQATFAPDTDNRWMGSAAMDHEGNLAVGYSISSTTTFPGVRYAGRLAADPLGGLFQGEATLIAGTGVQTNTGSRWGDYSAMNVDPTDDCTFWYTQEYYQTTDTTPGTSPFGVNWQTRVGSFKVNAGCVAPAQGTLQVNVTNCATGLPVSGATVSVDGNLYGTSNAGGSFSAQLPPGTYSVTAAAFNYVAGTQNGVVITNGGTTVVNICMTPVPNIDPAGATITAESCSPSDNALSPGETVTVDFGLKNSGTAATTNLVATLQATGGVTSPSGPQNYGAIPPDNTTVVTRPFTFTVDPSVACGDAVTATLQLQDGATNLGTVTFTLRVGVAVGAATATYSSGNIAVPIPDVSTAEISINVPDNGLVLDVNVRVRLNHTFDGDLTISLVHPDGTVINLANQRGGSGDNYGTGANDCSGTPTVFDDEAAATIAGGVAPFAGSFKPESSLSVLDGKLTPGTWKLRVADGFNLDTGTIGCVQLEITRSQFACCGVAGTRDIQAGPATLTTESCPPANNAIDPGERVTVDLELHNNGTAATTNLVATLVTGGGVSSPSLPQSYGVLTTTAGPSPSATRDFSFTASGVCGGSITATWNLNDGPDNLGTVTKTFQLGATVNTTTTFSNSAPITIPDTPAPAPEVAVPYPSAIVVAGVTGTVSKVTVKLTNLNHTFPGDIDILLVGPGGQKMMLMSDVGGSTDSVNATLTFDDAAATGIGATVVTGTFKPTNIGTGDVFPAPAPAGPHSDPQLLSVFNSVNPNGTWNLYVVDDAGGDAGNINGGWELNITTSTIVCTTPCGIVRLVVTSTLSRPNGATVQATYTVQNTGTVTAANVMLTDARLGATNGTPLPQSLGSLAPGQTSAPMVVNFTNSTPGASTTLRLNGTYTGGTFSSTKRVTIP